MPQDEGLEAADVIQKLRGQLALAVAVLLSVGFDLLDLSELFS